MTFAPPTGPPIDTRTWPELTPPVLVAHSDDDAGYSHSDEPVLMELAVPWEPMTESHVRELDVAEELGVEVHEVAAEPDADELVMAFAARDNAELIEQCAQLGYLAHGRRVLDATYGKGRFWKRWRPDGLITNDIDPDTEADYHLDFRDLSAWPDGHFADIVLDPPYKLNGTSTGAGPSQSDEGYGVGGEYVRWQDRHALIVAGIEGCHRKLAVGGRLLVKCQDQVCSGAVRWQTRWFADAAESMGSTLIDQLHLPGARSQPAGRRQVHSRRNYSTLLVLLKTRPTGIEVE